jgi:hypothetical protein
MSTFALMSLLLQPTLADDTVRTGVVRAVGAGVPAGTVVEVLGVQGVRETLAVSADGTFEVRWPEGSTPVVRARVMGPPPLLSEARSLRGPGVLELRPITTVDVQLQPATGDVCVWSRTRATGTPSGGPSTAAWGGGAPTPPDG